MLKFLMAISLLVLFENAKAQPVTIDLTNPTYYDQYDPANNNRTYIGRYNGPYSRLTDPFQVSANSYNCYEYSPGETSCGTSLGVYASTVTINGAELNNISLNLAIVANDIPDNRYRSFQLAITCRSGTGAGIGCVDSCTITGASRLLSSLFIFPMSSGIVTISCPTPIVAMSYLSQSNYVFAKSVTIGAIIPVSSLDLKIESISIPDSAIAANNKFSVSPGIHDVVVKVSGTGFDTDETRTTEVSLQVGSNDAVKKTINLSQVKAAGLAGYPVTFSGVQFTSDQVGALDLTAKVNLQSAALPETSTADNSKTQGMYVLCKVEDVKGREVTFWAQTDRRWANDDFGIKANSSVPGTMFQYGCTTTSFAMLADYYNIFRAPLGSPVDPYLPPFTPKAAGLNGELLTPKTMNQAFSNYKSNFIFKGSTALNGQNDVIWQGMAEVARAGYKAQCTLTTPQACDPNKLSSIISYIDYKEGFDDSLGSADRKAVDAEICKGNPVILKFNKTADSTKHHFMLATGILIDENGNRTYRLNNPGTVLGAKQLQSNLKNVYASIVGYIKFDSTSDPSMLHLAAPTSVHFIVTDALGRKTGFNPQTNTSFNEIPGASYALQSINTPADDGIADQTLVSERVFNYSTSTDIPEGSYLVQVFALTSGSYYLDYRGYDSNGNTNASTVKAGTLSAGQSAIQQFVHSKSSVSQASAKLKLEEYSIRKRPRNNFSQSDIKIEGQLEKFDRTDLKLVNSFKLTIGGITGYTLSIPASEFKQKRAGRQTEYFYKSRLVEIKISSKGEVDIEIEKADLSSLEQTQFKYIGISVGSVFADLAAEQQCRKNACRLVKHGHCQFDKEDEE